MTAPSSAKTAERDKRRGRGVPAHGRGRIALTFGRQLPRHAAERDDAAPALRAGLGEAHSRWTSSRRLSGGGSASARRR